MSPRTPLLVGLVIVMAVLGMTYAFMSTSKDSFDEASTYPLYADFDDASGIRWKTRVQINGIDVGKIVGIQHARNAQGRLVARVSLRVLKEFEVYDDGALRKAAESLLGDFRLDLDPGTPAGRKLAPGSAIPRVLSQSDIDEIKGQLLQVSRHVNEVSESFSKVLSGPSGEGSLKTILSKVESSMNAIEQTTQVLQHTIAGNDQVFSHIIHNVGDISAALAKISAPEGDLRNTSHHLASLSEKLDRMADAVGGMLSGTENGVADPNRPTDAGSLRSTLDNLNDSIGHINAIARKVDEGQGTLGRVINDSTIVDRVESTLDSANELIGSVAGLETQLELRSEYDVPFEGSNEQVQRGIKNTLGLRIFPKPDKYYIIEAISDPRGRQSRKITSTQIQANAPIQAEETVIEFNVLKFSAQFAKRYYFLTMRFGIIENTGGLGFNLHGFDDDLEVRVDAFDFDRRDPAGNRDIFPRVRLTGMYELINHVHVQAGFDDPFNINLRTWFLGGVLRFTDEDLKALLVVAPKP